MLSLGGLAASLGAPRGCRLEWTGIIPATLTTASRHEFEIVMESSTDVNTIACSNIEVWRDAPTLGWNVYLASLRYQTHQKECTLPGSTELEWLIGLWRSKVVDSVTLVDAATKTITYGALSADVGLTSYLKLTTGKGWYERFGFLPSSDYERYLFQESFDSIRHASSDDLATVLYLIFRLCLSTTGSTVTRNDKVPPGELELHLDTIVRACAQLMLRELVEDEDALRDNVRSQLENMTREHFDALHGVIALLGMSNDARADLPVSTVEREWMDVHIPRGTGPKCVHKKLATSNSRKLQQIILGDLPTPGSSRRASAGMFDRIQDPDAAKDVIDFLVQTNTVLKLLQDVWLLVVPDFLTCTSGAKGASGDETKRSCSVSVIEMVDGIRGLHDARPAVRVRPGTGDRLRDALQSIVQ